MKYKVGDRVLIKSIDWYNKNKDVKGNVPCGNIKFIKSMTHLCGKVLTIRYINNGGYFMDVSIWKFTDEMIEKLATKCDICGAFGTARCIDMDCNNNK